MLREFTGPHGPELEFSNPHWRLRVRVGDRLDPYELVKLPSGRRVADESYCYRLTVGSIGQSGYRGGPVDCRRVAPVSWSVVDEETLVLTGELDFGPSGPTDLRLEHRIQLATDRTVLETVALVHHHGRDRHQLSNLRFGFRKTLFDRSSHQWAPGADTGELVPVPLRRYAGQSTDHHLAGYTAADLMPEEWTGGGLPDRSAEAWLWCENDFGFLVAKYDQRHIEFSVADGEFVARLPVGGEQRAALHVSHLNSHQNLCLRFGGVGVSRGCPETAAELGPSETLTFGTSIIRTFVGDWQQGFAAYKGVLRQRGHVVPRNYAPRIHWNELYRLGWRCGGNAPLQELPDLWAEAGRAQAMGAQAFYFDPGWDLFEGSSVWDTARLGPIDGFVSRLRDDFGLSLSLHLMMHTKSLDENPEIYRRRPDGEIDVWLDNTPYAGGYVCPASPVWKRQKTDQLLALADKGVNFFMFDFLSYEHAVIKVVDQPTSQVATCWSADHGHSVPLTREEHAEGIMDVIRAVKAQFRDVSIEAHDRIGGEFLPLYYQHATLGAHDELWGFEYMWDPYADLLSGKALSLYEYNLAYDIPLYLHINCAHDSPTLLAFWWYASTCRHFGIGGIDPSSPLWELYRRAMTVYLRLQELFAQGEFIGIDPLTHVHVHGRRESAVLVAFNLTSEPVSRRVILDRRTWPFDGAPVVDGARVERIGGELELHLTIAPLSPLVVEIELHRTT